MSDPTISSSAVGSAQQQTAQVPPVVGLLEVVEAFTAMRHEWKTQTKESRELALSVSGSTELLQQIASSLESQLALISDTDNTELNALLATVIELDLGLQRAIDAGQSIRAAGSKDPRDELSDAIQRQFQRSGVFNRWFGRLFYSDVLEAISSMEVAQPEATLEGIRIVLQRLRRSMADQNLLCVDTLGKPFDPATMTAIGKQATQDYASGCVVQQISPAYLYRSKLLRYAEVIVAS